MIAIAAACASLAHAANGPSLLDSIGKLLNPAATAPAAGSRTLAVAPSSQGRRIALVIGNGDYQHPENLPKLANPANDAEDVAEALRGFGFEVIERKNQTLQAMNQTIAEFGSKIGGSEAALFYFAGHGIQVKNQNYLMPVNAKIDSEAAVPYEGVDMNRILDEMDNAKSSANIVMLDACRNNPISGKFRNSKSRGLAPVSVPKGTVIVYATDPGNVAADGEGRNGLFTAGLLTAFKGKELSLDDVLTVASAEVERASGNTQTPYVNGPKTLQKNFHFRVTVDPGRDEIEKTFWTSIEHSTDAADFEAYIRNYPNGSYRALAENQIRRLKASQPPIPAPAKVTDNPLVAVPPTPTPSTPVAVDPETSFWNEVKASGAREYCDAYLKQYPKGKYVALARVELKKFDDRDKAQKAKADVERKTALAREEARRNVAAVREKQEALRMEQEAWDRAKADGTAGAYAEYLGSFPNGRYATVAQTAQKKVQRDDVERERLETVRREREAKDMRPGTVFKDCADCPEMVVIPAGSLEMGSNNGDGDEKPPHRVLIGMTFALGKTEVTQTNWRAVMGSGSPELIDKGCDDCPMEKVSWKDAQEFVRKLSQKTSKTYRLPSEAEWEYACHAGGSHTFCGSDTLDSVAWYAGNSDNQPHAVASKQANAFGLYDMSGNVWEWTQDCWNSDYNGAPTDGRPWMSGDCRQHVLRGGSWGDEPRFARATSRDGVTSSGSSSKDGFRPVRVLP